MVVSTTVNKYINIAVSEGFEDHMRLSYSRTEIVKTVDEVEHPLIREALKLTGLTDNRLHIYSMGDVPAGTGLGSSSAFLVGLLKALWATKGIYVHGRALAEQACQIEIDILGEPIGKQDQYAAAFGGLRWMRFNTDGSVETEPVVCKPETWRALGQHLATFYLGSSRAARSILSEQQERMDDTYALMCRMRDMVPEFVRVLGRGTNLAELGEILHEGWMLKKQLASGVSNPEIDEYYERARRAGALGGKVLGAGGTGFLLMFCEPHLRGQVRDALSDLRYFEMGLEREGSRIVFLEP
jgi:D-glycero-alpha-D-manno-heptose-7-phosphate kinase